MITEMEEQLLTSDPVLLSGNLGLWEKCRNSFMPIEDMDVELRLNNMFGRSYYQICESVQTFRQHIGALPLVKAIDFWVSTISSDRYWGKHFIEQLGNLVSRGILKLLQDDKPRLVQDVSREEHINAIDAIRCVEDWSIESREKHVSLYLTLFRDLAKYTMDLIPRAFDPDRERVAGKLLEWPQFIEFIQKLSFRDAIIAKLLYFGAPSFESVLTLRTIDVDLSGRSIAFLGQKVAFPRHVIREIHEYVKTRFNEDGLLFINVRGEPLENTNLVHSFQRASSKLSLSKKITPSMLLKHKAIF